MVRDTENDVIKNNNPQTCSLPFALLCPRVAVFSLKVPGCCKVSEVATNILSFTVAKVLSADCVNVLVSEIGDVDISVVGKLGKGSSDLEIGCPKQIG